MKRLAFGLAVVALLVLLTTLFVMNRVDSFMDAPLAIPETGIDFDISPGSSFSGVARELKGHGLITDDLWLRVYVRWNGLAGGIQAGEYAIERGATPRSVLQQFTDGSVKLHGFTLVEGWNHHEVLAALHANEAVKHTLTDEDWPAFLTSIGASTLFPEGSFLPETYSFARGTSDRELLAQAYGLMQSVLEEEWSARDARAVVKTPYEALILASIVEKETARGDERAKIAGVFSRRLEQRMRLQTDPTVIYGIGPTFDGNLTRKHLRTDTAYNTYTRHGLPPTPIAMPGRAAIHAALHPESGNELYFVATGLPDGSHKFSATKDEHDAAVAEYLVQLRRNRSQANRQ